MKSGRRKRSKRAASGRRLGQRRPRPAARRGGAGTALKALTASALALLGLGQEARADAPVERTAANYAFSFYQEDALAPGQWSEASGGSRDRYEIFAHQFNVMAPLTARSDVGVDFVYESMSGASPWYVVDAGGKPLQAMTGATIEDQRVDVQLTPSHYFESGRIALTGGISVEKDYLAGNFGFSGQRHYNDKNTTVDAGVGFSWDEITPTDAARYGRISRAEKETVSLSGGLAQVLHRTAVAQISLVYKKSDGFLSDPYKEVFVGASRRFDKRPSERDQISLLARYRQHVAPLAGSLHFDYRFHWDDWELSSHTFELAWYQELFQVLHVIPSLRYYSQSEASFYKPFFAAFDNPQFYSSDYRLSPYGALAFGLKTEATLPNWPHRRIDTVLALSYDRYMSSGDWALGRVEVAAPGLVDYSVYGARVGARF